MIKYASLFAWVIYLKGNLQITRSVTMCALGALICKSSLNNQGASFFPDVEGLKMCLCT